MDIDIDIGPADLCWDLQCFLWEMCWERIGLGGFRSRMYPGIHPSHASSPSCGLSFGSMTSVYSLSEGTKD